MKKSIVILIIGLCSSWLAGAQERVGVNTTTPERPLHILGGGSQYFRLHTTSNSVVGLELMRGANGSNVRDWKIDNNIGDLRFATSSDNFSSTEQVMMIDEEGHVGIGTVDPMTPLHINTGEEVSLTEHGQLMIGPKSGINMVLDANEIQVRNNGSAASLIIQSDGGNTWFGDGPVYAGIGGGKVIVGDAPDNALFNVDGLNYQMSIINNVDGLNNWFIGASSGSWQTGDDQLLFSPTTDQVDAILRLHSQADNDGFYAPFMITAPSSQTLLMDGNEIDTRSNPLYINHNSDHNTYINPNGGRVGIGTTNPAAGLHVRSNEYGLGLQQNFATWWLSTTSIGDLQFYKNTDLLAYVDFSAGGAWVAVSDRRLKQNLVPLDNVLGRIQQIGLYRYQMIPEIGGFQDIGVIAQELENVFPEPVHEYDGTYGVNYDQLTVIAIKGLQEQQSQLESLIAKADAFLGK